MSDRAVTEQVEALFETVRTLAAIQQEATHTAWLHARNAGHEQLARRLAGVEERIGELIADELTWPEDKKVVDAFGPDDPLGDPLVWDRHE